MSSFSRREDVYNALEILSTGLIYCFRIWKIIKKCNMLSFFNNAYVSYISGNPLPEDNNSLYKSILSKI